MSYATLDEANAYINSHYLTTDTAMTIWTALTDDARQILLNRSHDVIDSLPVSGIKSSVTQVDAFPRNGATTVPTEVKNAEVELAVALADPEISEVQEQYRRMIDYGISSYSIGNFSESLLVYSKSSAPMQYGLVSIKAERLLKPWMNGGFCIG